ncbi:MAG: 3-dehydroquinate synthase [Pirellulaceae bacterium]|jgi:3-dehydroquinate synthase
MQEPKHRGDPRKLDIDFQVPYRHRLRFTDDCLGSDWEVVESLMEGSEGGAARVQCWVDQGVSDADPRLIERLEERLGGSDRLQATGPVRWLEGGEEVKNQSRWVDSVFEAIDAEGLDRRSYILVVGGGAVLDAVGYAAAIAHRGIRLVRIPTTTLAQGDSGVGVKNAINAFGKKNWKGTFAVPWGVVNDARLLELLPDRDFRCGFSESVKVALLKDSEFFQWLHRNARHIADRKALPVREALQRSVTLHLMHITRGGDPFESREARPLDFGHWSAHKLEGLSRYRLRHGEAVAIGVALDTAYSTLAHGLPPEVLDQTLQALGQLGLPVFDPLLDHPQLVDGLEEFRQHLGGRLTLTMLTGVGQPIDVHQVDSQRMKDAIALLSTRCREVTC